MRILALTEHFLPRLAGTATVVRETATALAGLGHDVTIVAPGPPNPADGAEPYRVHRLETCVPAHGDPSRKARYALCAEADRFVQSRAAGRNIDLVHVLFGLFLMESLDTAALRRRGIPSVATVHNVPPMETGRSWDGDRRLRQVLDRFRRNGVEAKNRRRLLRHRYDRYVVPSGQVSDLLRRVLPSADIAVLGHGVSHGMTELMQLPESRRPAAGAPVRLLTAGGYVPHKRQHIIPAIAARLRGQGIDIRWDVVGPTRNVPYFEAVRTRIAHHDVADVVNMPGAVDRAELARLYDRANLYVQPSTEEGFCLTALDAAAAGLPVIGSPAGALPEIVEASGGILSDSTVDALTAAIARFVTENLWDGDPLGRAARIRAGWTWRSTAEELTRLYHRLAAGEG